jgi:phosphoribosyl 1,2-cyclic phosphodiesterase
MEFCTFASSSGGNCALVREGNLTLLVDAGISARRIAQSLETLGLSFSDLSAVLITHEHTDHVAGLATLVKKCGVPIFASTATADALARQNGLLAPRLVAFAAGDTLSFGALEVTTFATSHDAAGSVGYRFDSADGSLGFLTDTGFVTEAAERCLLGVDALILEANHDVAMLRSGPYPAFLKQRVLGKEGHLSNDAAADFALQCVRHGTNDILLAHLSGENNAPAIAEYTVGRALQKRGMTVRLAIAPRECASEVHVCRKSRSFALEN